MTDDGGSLSWEQGLKNLTYTISKNYRFNYYCRLSFRRKLRVSFKI